ncbi:MAG: hypothetical protein LC799_30090 [Actinobacteria bacterium]|nr:hypothetical protein [Actinomycetota bacterium]
MHPVRRKARAALASAAARASRNPEDPAAAEAVIELRREYHAVTLEEHVRRVVAEFPPLSPAQRARIAALLRPSSPRNGGGDAAT